MNILILGAGAVGLGIAAKLSEVIDVTAITREGPARTISEHGLYTGRSMGYRNIPVSLLQQPASRGAF